METSDSNWTNCDIWPDNPRRCTYLLAARSVSASLSAIGVLLIILVIWAFDKYQFFAQRLIFWLSVTSFFSSVGYLLGGRYQTKSSLCIAQAIITQFCEWAMLLWICCIAANITYIMWRGYSPDRLYRSYHAFVWIISIVATAVPYGFDVYGPAGPWCWITHRHQVWIFASWYIPMWTVILLLSLVYIIVWRIVRRRVVQWSGTYTPHEEYQKKLLNEDLQQLKYYPLVYLLLALVPTADRMYDLLNGSSEFWLMLGHAAVEPLTGFSYVIAFLLDKGTREQLTCSHVYLAVLSHFTGRDIQEYQPMRRGRSCPGYGATLASQASPPRM